MHLQWMELRNIIPSLLRTFIMHLQRMLMRNVLSLWDLILHHATSKNGDEKISVVMNCYLSTCNSKGWWWKTSCHCEICHCSVQLQRALITALQWMNCFLMSCNFKAWRWRNLDPREVQTSAFNCKRMALSCFEFWGANKFKGGRTKTNGRKSA